MNFNYYQLYGLTLQTQNTIPHLQQIANCNQVDVTINFEETATQKKYPFKNTPSELYASYGLAPNKIPYLTVWKQYEAVTEFLIIRYTNGKETVFFVSDIKGVQIKVYYPPSVPLNDIYTYLLGPVIGCILRLKNKVCLHASVVNINQQAIAFIGEKTAGKSTLIAALAEKGYPVLSDDIAVLFQKNNIFQVHSGYPRLRLWRKSLASIKGIDIDKLDRVLGHIDKYYLPLHNQNKDAWKFQKNPLPLKAVIYLSPRNEKQYLNLTQYTLLEGFLKLKQNIYADYMLDNTLLQKEFNSFGQLSRQIPVMSLERPNDLQYMDEVCKIITSWAVKI